MIFDADKYSATEFRDRTAEVPVPQLKSFFKPDEDGKEVDAGKCVWVVRGLDGPESAKARQAVEENRNIEAVLNALVSTIPKEKAEGIKDIMSINSDKVPDDLVRRYSWLSQGSVEPKCDHRLAMLIAKNHPETFYALTNKIIQLTGQGRLGE